MGRHRTQLCRHDFAWSAVWAFIFVSHLESAAAGGSLRKTKAAALAHGSVREAGTAAHRPILRASPRNWPLHELGAAHFEAPELGEAPKRSLKLTSSTPELGARHVRWADEDPNVEFPTHEGMGRVSPFLDEAGFTPAKVYWAATWVNHRLHAARNQILQLQDVACQKKHTNIECSLQNFVYYFLASWFPGSITRQFGLAYLSGLNLFEFAEYPYRETYEEMDVRMQILMAKVALENLESLNVTVEEDTQLTYASLYLLVIRSFLGRGIFKKGADSGFYTMWCEEMEQVYKQYAALPEVDYHVARTPRLGWDTTPTKPMSEKKRRVPLPRDAQMPWKIAAHFHRVRLELLRALGTWKEMTLDPWAIAIAVCDLAYPSATAAQKYFAKEMLQCHVKGSKKVEVPKGCKPASRNTDTVKRGKRICLHVQHKDRWHDFKDSRLVSKTLKRAVGL